MKKCTAFVLVLCLLLALVGCGSSQTSSSSAPAAPAASGGSEAEAQPAESDWPTSTVQLLVPAAAGGATDLSARAFASVLQSDFSSDFVVVNQTDGSGVVAFENTRNAPTDATTLLYYHSGIFVSIATGLYDKNPLEDFTVISNLPAGGSYSVVVAADSPYNTMEDLINDAKANPGKITAGIQNGSSSHIMTGMLIYDTGADFKMIEAGSDQEKLAAMQGGHMTFCFLNSKNAKPYTESGDLKILATIAGSPDRDPNLPDIPSLYELGYEDCLYGTDFYILGPKGIDEATVEKINAAIGEAVNVQSVIDVHNTINMPVEWLNVEDSITRMTETQDSIFKVAQAIGLMK